MQPNFELEPANVVELKAAIKEARDHLDQAIGAVQVALRSIVKAGRLLKQAKGELDHGEWYAWLESNVPDISRETARRWIRLAEFAELHAADLEKASTIRQAYVLAGLLPHAESGSGSARTSQSESYFVYLLRTTTHLNALISKRPIDQWPDEDKAELKNRLKPLVEIYEKLSA